MHLINCLRGCPDAKVLYPCKCANNSITCSGSDDYDLQRIFETISDTSSNDNKYFNRLTLNISQLSYIADNDFEDIMFREIVIENAINLANINANAFKVNSLYTESFTIKGAKGLIKTSADENNFFTLLRSLQNAKQIEIHNTNVNSIPEFAFLESQRNLERIAFKSSLADTKLKEISNFAFMSPKLKSLDLSRNSIMNIKRNAFHFKNYYDLNEQLNDTITVIDLQSNRINDSSLENGLFDFPSRPLNINLANNSLTVISEQTFIYFLKRNFTNNKLNVRLNPIDCFDCRMFWLYELRNEYMQNIEGLQCENGKTFWQIDSKEFNKCKDNYVTDRQTNMFGLNNTESNFCDYIPCKIILSGLNWLISQISQHK